MCEFSHSLLNERPISVCPHCLSLSVQQTGAQTTGNDSTGRRLSGAEGREKARHVSALAVSVKRLPLHLTLRIVTSLRRAKRWWRAGRDSNPRWSYKPHTPLAGERFRPLSHLPAIAAATSVTTGEEVFYGPVRRLSTTEPSMNEILHADIPVRGPAEQKRPGI